jgi:hypothetical protein
VHVYAPIFRRIRDGTLKVDTKRARVYYRRSPRSPWRRMKPIFRHSGNRGEQNDHGYWFVSIGFTMPRSRRRHRRRKIALHRLVWLVDHNRETVPHGCDIHHINSNTDDNRAPNLTHLTVHLNRSHTSPLTSEEDF